MHGPWDLDELKFNQADYGLPYNNEARLRHVTSHACTCQFHTCWGLPCRHMLRLYLQLNVTEIPQGLVKSRWLKHDEKYVEERKRILLRTVPMQNNPCNKPRKMTRFDRYNYLLSESKSLVEIASTSEETMEVLVKHLDMAKSQISKLPFVEDLEQEAHSLDPTLFPTTIVLNPGLPIAHGRPQTKRKDNFGKYMGVKSQKRYY